MSEHGFMHCSGCGAKWAIGSAPQCSCPEKVYVLTDKGELSLIISRLQLLCDECQGSYVECVECPMRSWSERATRNGVNHA